jgi:hypothetical protein
LVVTVVRRRSRGVTVNTARSRESELSRRPESAGGPKKTRKADFSGAGEGLATIKAQPQSRALARRLIHRSKSNPNLQFKPPPRRVDRIQKFPKSTKTSNFREIPDNKPI